MKRFIARKYLSELNSNKKVDSLKKYEQQQFKENIESFNIMSKEETSRKESELKSYKNNRQFITEVFYDVLDRGLRSMRELNPSDPFEFLVN